MVLNIGDRAYLDLSFYNVKRELLALSDSQFLIYSFIRPIFSPVSFPETITFILRAPPYPDIE